MLSKKQIGYIFVLVGFFTIIITTLFFQDYEYVKYVKGAGL
ncbi:Trifolitoxin immunity domain protein [Bacillus toyonensis]|nr:Trifolitoxin immunity domain protein [Bacillus toyonensis]MCA1043903.1 Trifolitoxin immunity domain protein [Bacillus toyonensis]MED3200395.1 Trifolitoxin immunity domain protein [Bacillus toyonensis]